MSRYLPVVVAPTTNSNPINDDPKTMTTVPWVRATTRHPCILPNRAVEPAKSRCLLAVCDITLV